MNMKMDAITLMSFIYYADQKASDACLSFLPKLQMFSSDTLQGLRASILNGKFEEIVDRLIPHIIFGEDIGGYDCYPEVFNIALQSNNEQIFQSIYEAICSKPSLINSFKVNLIECIIASGNESAFNQLLKDTDDYDFILKKIVLLWRLGTLTKVNNINIDFESVDGPTCVKISLSKETVEVKKSQAQLVSWLKSAQAQTLSNKAVSYEGTLLKLLTTEIPEIQNFVIEQLEQLNIDLTKQKPTQDSSQSQELSPSMSHHLKIATAFHYLTNTIEMKKNSTLANSYKPDNELLFQWSSTTLLPFDTDQDRSTLKVGSKKINEDKDGHTFSLSGFFNSLKNP